ncbi:unnamed protein product [Calypogeia fissa]
MRDTLDAKAKIAYLVKPTPPDPGELPSVLEVLLVTIMAEAGWHVWDCLLNPTQFCELKALVRASGKSDLLAQWVMQCRNTYNWRNAPTLSTTYFEDLKMKCVLDGLSVLTSMDYDVMSEEVRGWLKKHSDLALLWLDAKKKLLKWEESDELKVQQVGAQTTYQIWKHQHKQYVLQTIRDKLYIAQTTGTELKDHDSAIAHGELKMDIHDESDRDEEPYHLVLRRRFTQGSTCTLMMMTVRL